LSAQVKVLIMKTKRFSGAILVALLLLASAETGFASDWTNPTLGDWFIASNWNAGVPDGNTAALIFNGGTALLTAPGATSNFLWVGIFEDTGGNGTLLASNAGTLTTGDISVGRVNFSQAPAVGNLNISSGAVVTATTVTIGQGVGGGGPATGTVDVTGTGSRLNAQAGPIVLGTGNATGTLVVENGGRAHSPGGSIGIGSATVQGSGSLWDSTEAMYVGNGSANSSLQILNGGEVRAPVLKLFNGLVDVDNGSSTVSGLTISGVRGQPSGGSLGVLIIGNNTAGRMEILIGGTVFSYRGFLGANAGSFGSALVTDAGSKWTATGSIWVGNSGSGTLDVLNGGTVTSSGNGYLAFSNNTTGSATISGAGSAWTMSDHLYIGGNGAAPGGSGQLVLQNGGAVTAIGVTLWDTGIMRLGANATLNGPLTVLGGAIETANNITFPNDFTLGTGGLFVRTYGFSSTFSGVISGSGGLTKSGSFTGSGPGTLTLTGNSTYSGPTTISFGKLVVDGSIASAVTVNSGAILGGSGTVGGITINSGGILAPGDSPGILTVNGNYTQQSGGVLNVELGGATAGTGFDQVAVSGSATVDGVLNLSLVNGFQPIMGQRFAIITSSSETGNFSTINSSGFAVRSDASNAGIVLTVTSGAPPPTTLANISTRLRVETGDNVLIGGFIVTGTQPKKVIVRAIGPSLPLAGALADPILELRDSSGSLIFSNDNWRSDQEAEIIATTIPPANDLESAIVATLPANNSAYTAIVRGVNNGTGIGVVEAYDLDISANSKLANISTRGFVETGDNVLIGGLIVQGQNPLRVIVRAIGPSLSLPGALGDPTLELRDGNGGLIDANDNWRSDHEAEIIATTIPPLNDLESAIVRDLAPGNYTAIVRGVNSTTGIAVIEAYGLN
jgi:T5SS/PEP-CTERM-associated repeat protein/autotransporter-associated beta strand protein